MAVTASSLFEKTQGLYKGLHCVGNVVWIEDLKILEWRPSSSWRSSSLPLAACCSGRPTAGTLVAATLTTSSLRFLSE